MSCGVRDLRDLICVFRLIVWDSDEEVIFDDEVVVKDFDVFLISSVSLVESLKYINFVERYVFFDLGCVINSSILLEIVIEVDVIFKRIKFKKRKKRDKKLMFDIIFGIFDFLKVEVLFFVVLIFYGLILFEI